MPKQPSPEEWTVPGLTHRKKGEYWETVETKAATFGLVHSGTDLELMEVRLKKGDQLIVAPYDDPAEGGTEAYHILSGRLIVEDTNPPVSIGPGDVLVARSLTEVVSFVADEEVVLMGITARPTFHQISTEMGDLMRIATSVEEKDGYTAEHCQRLQKYSLAIARVMGLNHSSLYLLGVGSYLHDLGKVKVPPEILGKKGPLTPAEWLIMQRHPTWGRELLEGTFLEAVGPILEQHHERLDGSGYPGKLKGDEILLESLIVAVADTYDAITTDRPYRKGASPAEALAELRRFAEIHYPSAVIDAFEVVLKNEDLLPSQ